MVADDDLAGELRALAHTLHETHADEQRRTVAFDLLRQANAQLAIGERRLRWYEKGPEHVGLPTRNRELSGWSGSVNAVAPPMRLELGEHAGAPAMVGHVRLSRLREGPPGSVHGGVVAGLFDEVMGAASRLEGRPGGLTGRLTVRYRRPTPLDVDLVLRAWVHDDRPTRITVRAELEAPAAGSSGPRVTASAEAFFVRPRP